MKKLYGAVRKAFGFGLLLTGLGSSAYAVLGGAPEIDAGSAAGACALLVAGALMLKEKFSRK